MQMKHPLFASLTILFSLWTNSVSAEIAITNGIFRSTFDCDDWIRSEVPSQLDCDGFRSADNNCAGDCEDSIPCTETSNCKAEAIHSWANNPDGVANTAAQVHYFYTGADGTGSTNNCSGGMQIDFPEALTEFWFRFYVYYPKDSHNAGWKIIYFQGDGANPWMAQPYTSQFIGMYFPNGSGVIRSTEHPASWMDENGGQGYGLWIPLEVYIRNDTDNSDGIFRVWRGTELVIDETSIDTGVNNWTGIHLGSNGDGITGPADSVVGIQLDDIALATADYTEFVVDGHGNQRIGLLDVESPDADAGPPDAALEDAALEDAAPPDAAHEDAGPLDAAPGDTGLSDAEIADAEIPDGSTSADLADGSNGCGCWVEQRPAGGWALLILLLAATLLRRKKFLPR